MCMTVKTNSENNCVIISLIFKFDHKCKECHPRREKKQAHTRQRANDHPSLKAICSNVFISFKQWCSFSLFLPLQVKAAAHAELKDKATFHTDTRAARGDVGWPTCPLISLNIHWWVDRVRSARIRVVLKNFTSPPGFRDWLWAGDRAGMRRKADGATSMRKHSPTAHLQAPPAAYSITLGKTNRGRDTKSLCSVLGIEKTWQTHVHTHGRT